MEFLFSNAILVLFVCLETFDCRLYVMASWFEMSQTNNYRANQAFALSSFEWNAVLCLINHTIVVKHGDWINCVGSCRLWFHGKIFSLALWAVNRHSVRILRVETVILICAAIIKEITTAVPWDSVELLQRTDWTNNKKNM